MKKRWIVPVIIGMLICGCGTYRAEPGMTVPAERSTEGAGETEDAEKRYEFFDEAVKREVEAYLGKSADELDHDDISSLAEFDHLIVNESVSSLKDIGLLFPNIRYLKIDYAGSLTEEDCAVLKNLTSLQALTIRSGINHDRSFADGLMYLELSCPDPEENSNLSAYSVLGQETVDQNITGMPLKFIRFIKEQDCYELVITDRLEEEIFFEQERKVFISSSDGKRMVCNAVLDASGPVGDFADNRIILVDVNFDGQSDLLIDNGHFGNQGLVTYTCFLNRDGDYERCDSFSEIANPAVDNVNKKILSSWRNRASSHSWAMYRNEGDEYILTDCLTERAVILLSANTESEIEEFWEYIIEKRVNGEMQQVEYFTSKERTSEEISRLIYDAESEWGLRSDKWSTLYNNGKMSDFSIYNSNDPESTILDMIGGK